MLPPFESIESCFVIVSVAVILVLDYTVNFFVVVLALRLHGQHQILQTSHCAAMLRKQPPRAADCNLKRLGLYGNSSRSNGCNWHRKIAGLRSVESSQQK